MDPLNDLEVFTAVAEAQGFRPAARRLGITTSGASKSVARLEDRLGVRLFTRTTRRVALTEEGRRFQAGARDVLDRLAAAEDAVRDSADGLSGPVRMTMPVLVGLDPVLPALAAFRKTHPGVELDLRFGDATAALVEAGIDLAIRIGTLPDSGLHARKLAETRLVTCCAPAYAKAHGAPEQPQDLPGHTCIRYTVRDTGRPWIWRFAGGETYEPPPELAVDDGAAYHRLARAGLGLVHDLDFHFRDDLKTGTLVPVLEQHAVAGPPVWLVYPEGRYLPRRVRALIDYLAEVLPKALRPA